MTRGPGTKSKAKEKALYDVLIVGAGQAGPPLAIALAKKRWRVALAERKLLGGSCVNFGCTPTKAVIASARVAWLARRAGEFGIRIPSVEPDLEAVLDRARGIARSPASPLPLTLLLFFTRKARGRATGAAPTRLRSSPAGGGPFFSRGGQARG